MPPEESSSPSVSRRAGIILSILVGLVSALVGGFFGKLAGWWYDNRDTFLSPPFDQPHPVINVLTGTGMTLGAVGGLLVGFGWSLAMTRLTNRNVRKRGSPSAALVFHGIWLGVAAGITSTVVLHLGLATAGSNFSRFWGDVTGGSIFGIGAGLICGLVCGFIWWAICRRIFPRGVVKTEDSAP